MTSVSSAKTVHQLLCGCPPECKGCEEEVSYCAQDCPRQCCATGRPCTDSCKACLERVCSKDCKCECCGQKKTEGACKCSDKCTDCLSRPCAKECTQACCGSSPRIKCACGTDCNACVKANAKCSPKCDHKACKSCHPSSS